MYSLLSGALAPGRCRFLPGGLFPLFLGQAGIIPFWLVDNFLHARGRAPWPIRQNAETHLDLPIVVHGCVILTFTPAMRPHTV